MTEFQICEHSQWQKYVQFWKLKKLLIFLKSMEINPNVWDKSCNNWLTFGFANFTRFEPHGEFIGQNHTHRCFHYNLSIVDLNVTFFTFVPHWKIKIIKIKIMDNIDGRIWGLAFNQYFYVWFHDHHIKYFFLRHSKINIWPWKFNVKVVAKVKIDRHIWGLAFNWYFFSFFILWQSIFVWDTAK